MIEHNVPRLRGRADLTKLPGKFSYEQSPDQAVGCHLPEEETPVLPLVFAGRRVPSSPPSVATPP